MMVSSYFEFVKCVDEFVKCAEYSEKGGVYSYRCSKGLWGVECRDKHQAIQEAYHYFEQYYSDGEYDDCT